MEEQKLVRRKKKAQVGGNRRTLADACGDLASFYFQRGRYEDALDEFREQAEVCEELDLKLEWGNCNRMIAETYTMLAEFHEALKYEEKHLEVARELCDGVEEQRALATLGRIHLLQGQSRVEAQDAELSLKAAERAFMKSLVLCESLKGKVGMHEVMDMRARLLLNIGVVLEHLGTVDKAVSFVHKAIAICVSQDLFETLHRCYVTEAHLHSDRSADTPRALACLNKALEVAARLQDKTKQCETLALKADVLCKMSDYQSAKQVLLKAWKLDTPNPEDKANIENNLRVAAAVCQAEELLLSTDASDHAALARLYEKVGDGTCALRNYAGAADAYLSMLEHAQRAGHTGKQLIPIYVSLYQTYKDMGRYSEALTFYEKEYELIKEDAREAYVTLCNIAETHHIARSGYERVERACCEARVHATELGQKYKMRLLKRLLKYQQVYGEAEKAAATRAELRLLGCPDPDTPDSDDDSSTASDSQRDTAKVGEEVRIDELTDVSAEEEGEERPAGDRTTRGRARCLALRRNVKGETQLHVACISGNLLLAERLLAAGHPVNVRDHAGWLPLHEACIHGHAHLARLLIDHGAQINDRGGADCDGVTPIYDAACNGHLDIVQLLLHKGAIPTLKTDFGETSLDALQKWRKQNILNTEEETQYKSICNKINNFLEKRNIDDTPNNTKSPKTISPPSASKHSTCFTDSEDAPLRRRRNQVLDDSDVELDLDTMREQCDYSSDDTSNADSQITNKKYESVSEYKNVISALRNRNLPEESNKEVQARKCKVRSALLAPEEVGDDWLEDDLGMNNNKKRKVSGDNVISAAKKKSIENIKESIANINLSNITHGEKLNRSDSDVSADRTKSCFVESDNSTDSDNFKMTENINPKLSSIEHLLKGKIIDSSGGGKIGDSRHNMKKRCKRQSTLLRAGFRRRASSSNSGSDCQVTAFNTDALSSFTTELSQRRLNSPSKVDTVSTFSRKSSNERICSSRRTEISPGSASTSNFARKSSNERFCSTSERTANGVPSLLQPTVGGVTAPAAVRVKVEDKVLLVSLNLKIIDKLRIGWLVEEVKNRYYKLAGARPLFSLLTSDGAILSEEDPLSLVLTSPELHTCISGWKACPAEERYLECCAALHTAPSEVIQAALARSEATRRVTLGAGELPPHQVRPLLRALAHRAHLTALLLPRNRLGDAGARALADCLRTLDHLAHLDISHNDVSDVGVEALLDALAGSPRRARASLERLEVSGNPLGDAGLAHAVRLSGHVRLTALRVRACGATASALPEGGALDSANLDSLQVLDLSENALGLAPVQRVLLRVSASTLTELQLESVGVCGARVAVFLGKFFETATDIAIEKFNLSNCSLTDGDFMKFYRYLCRAKSLECVTLKGNALTFITLKKLLRRAPAPPVPRILLTGCPDIFKYSLDSDFPTWLPAIHFGRSIPEIDVTAPTGDDAQREGYKAFSKIWLACFGGRGLMEHAEGGVIRFTSS